jgi:hypothetical protein
LIVSLGFRRAYRDAGIRCIARVRLWPTSAD